MYNIISTGLYLGWHLIVSGDGDHGLSHEPQCNLEAVRVDQVGRRRPRQGHVDRCQKREPSVRVGTLA
jgi:hypothetical protein